ncbi:MAG: sensor histidine kinase [Oscillospiraceae bacterium]|nr:sensor histidine kinase [Oscillospiraceae bacterium]
MQELSLNILDIAQNSIVANATLIEIGVEVDEKDFLTITIRDNGKGMDEESVKNVINPFFTSRTTRKVGLGVPFFKQAAEDTGGSFHIESQVGVGTTIKAVFDTTNIDYTPLGEVWDTVAILIQMNETIDFVYTVRKDGEEFVCDTRQLREIMEGMPLSDLNVVQWIKEFIRENQTEILKRSY